MPRRHSRDLGAPLSKVAGAARPDYVATEAMDTNDAGVPPPAPAPESASDAITPEQVRTMLRRVKDPELNLNIVDLGLVYDIAVHDSADVHVQMTLTSPGCPSGPEIMSDAQRAIEGLDGVRNVDIELVWTPYWTPERIDPRLRAFLGG